MATKPLLPMFAKMNMANQVNVVNIARTAIQKFTKCFYELIESVYHAYNIYEF